MGCDARQTGRPAHPTAQEVEVGQRRKNILRLFFESMAYRLGAVEYRPQGRRRLALKKSRGR